MKAETPLYQHQEEIHLFTRKKTLISLLTDLPPIKMIMGEWKPAVRVRSKLILVKNVYRGGGRGGILCLTNVRSSVGLHHSSQQGQHMKLISHQLPTGPLLHWSANVIRPPHKRCGKQTGELPKHNGAYERCSQKKKKKNHCTFQECRHIHGHVCCGISFQALGGGVWGRSGDEQGRKEWMEPARVVHTAAGGFNHRMKVKLFLLNHNV